MLLFLVKVKMLDRFKRELLEKKEIYLRFKVFPGAQKTEIKDILDDKTIKINIRAIPEKGKANNELMKFISKEFKVELKSVIILSGKSSRLKLIKIKC